MKLAIVGCGDAFGSGGRLQTCYHVEAAGTRFLIDCGATALIGLNRLGIDPNTIETIFISHLHGDHYAGLVWWLIHAQHVAKRTVPLTVVGPPSVKARFEAAAEALFPGSSTVPRRFEMRFQELTRAMPLQVGSIRVAAFEVEHPSGAPSHALRFDIAGKVLAFTGDTQWTEALVPAGQGADLYIMECFHFEGAPRYHMSWMKIAGELDRICICSQAPGVRVHASGTPFTDPSGDRLRTWLGLSAEQFYDQRRIAIVPMGFCFPGHDDAGGDLPPRRECARAWHERLFSAMPQLELILAVGSYAQRWHLGAAASGSMTDTVTRWRTLLEAPAKPRRVPLPHPSWRNNAWLAANPWFERDLLPRLRREIARLL